MAETIKIAQAGFQEDVAEFARGHSEKLQALARNVVSGLYMLVRSAKMYDPDNAVFDKPLRSLAETINAILAKEGRFDLLTVKQSVYLNNMLIKVDLNALENVRYLVTELRAKDVGGFSMSKPTTVTELQNFIWIFSKETQGSVEEDGLGTHKLVNMKVAKWSRLKEKLATDVDNSDEQKVDRKKYAMTVYGRTVFFLTRYLESVRAGKPMGTSRALRLVQDFVDISFDHRTHFLGLTTLKRDQDYLVHHQVNVCLMSIVFGCELGLTKPQLRDLGFIALFHDVGMATVPQEIALKEGALTPEERSVIQKTPLVSIRTILMEKSITRSTLTRVVTTLEHKVDYGTAVRDAAGNVQMIIPKTNLGVYSRILAICDAYDALTSHRPFRDAYGPEVALMLMWTEMRHKFDPELLKVFMRVMAIQPVKVMSRRQRTLNVGGL
ncbi:MAG TPA: HD domain-containing phosphohydrolase [Myxococcaceae bacterium]|nr:HD domain-containing phosphohydrolase [Myxococcaceae bacterium]